MDGDTGPQPKKRRIGDDCELSDEAKKASDLVKRQKAAEKSPENGGCAPGQSCAALSNGDKIDCVQDLPVNSTVSHQGEKSRPLLDKARADLPVANEFEDDVIVNGDSDLGGPGKTGSDGETLETQPYDMDSYEEETSEDTAFKANLVTEQYETISRDTQPNKIEHNNKDSKLQHFDCSDLLQSEGVKDASTASSSTLVDGEEKPCIIIEPRASNPDVIDLTQTDDSCPALLKIPSIKRDAEEIAALLNITDVDAVYEMVSKKRMLSNRVEVVTDSILENGLDNLCTRKNIVHPSEINCPASPVAAVDDEDETFSAIFSDIDSVKFILQQRHPNLVVDPNLIYAELEVNFHNPNRVMFVANLITKVQQNQQQREEEMDVDELIVDKGNQKSSKNQERCSTDQNKAYVESELVDEVDVILKRFPNADESEVYMLLRENSDCENRLELVIDKLVERMKRETLNELRSSKKPPPSCTQSKPRTETEASEKEEVQKMSSEEEELINNDAVYRDTCIISKLFPDRDKNEIYAYLEAHHNRPNRIAIVTEELLKLQEQSQENRADESTESTEMGKAAGGDAGGGTESGNAKAVSSGGVQGSEKASGMSPAGGSSAIDSAQVARPLHEELQIPIADEELQPLVRLEQDVDTLRGVFPECDPMWLYEQLAMRQGDENRVHNLTSEMFEHRTYPRLKDRLEKEKKRKAKQQMLNLKLNIHEFLDMFPNPCAHFSNVESQVSESYKQHCKTKLRNWFPYASSGYIEQCITRHNGHFTPALRELEEAYNDLYSGRTFKGRKKYRRSPREHEPMPEEPDAYFYKELLYVTHQQEIADHLKVIETEKEERLAEARKNKELMECGCCFDDEVLPEDTLTCPQAHVFCKDCIRRSTEEVIGQAKIKFPCLGGDCESEFPLSTLKKALSPKVFSNLLRKTQEEEIRQADIPDLVTCPFCSFATIMENENDKVFKCQNPECLKESCRLCREPSHIPLRCEEVEKQGETSMRTFIENKMTEAMLRECFRCKKRFYKTEGCNKMTCACGASMCYVCRQPIRGYEHFQGPNGCPPDTDVFELHRREMERAAQEAKQKYTDDHPEAAQTQLKHDPMQHLDKRRRRGVQPAVLFPPAAGALDGVQPANYAAALDFPHNPEFRNFEILFSRGANIGARDGMFEVILDPVAVREYFFGKSRSNRELSDSSSNNGEISISSPETISSESTQSSDSDDNNKRNENG